MKLSKLRCDIPRGKQLFSGLLRDRQAENATPDRMTSQLTQYFAIPRLPESDDPLAWWKMNASQFPEMAKLACKYLAIPTSSSPAERIFSTAGKVVRPDRACLSDERFDNLMFIGCNMK